MRQAIAAALRRDPDLVPKMARSLRERIDDDGAVASMVQAAEALEPIIADAVEKRPSRLNRLGLRSAHLLASLAEEDDRSNRQLARIARGSSVGIVFVDVAEFTTYTATHGDDDAVALLGRLNDRVASCTKAARGEVVKRLGDGFLIAFPSASQAVRAAVALQEAAQRDPKIDVRIRVAVHAGEPLVEQDDLLGHDVNLTARLLDHCRPGSVVVSEAAKDLAERRLKKIGFGSRKRVKVRGLAGKVEIYTAERKQEAA
ncbi:MAG: adenylate/guanylate cyclase domain-containing protein [Actinomycetota bacterium]|nr:adenylate/guanylate cyclase domain-containing protein [Actinomycetota bacterium]